MNIGNFFSESNLVKVFFVVFVFLLGVLFLTIIKSIKEKRNSKVNIKAKIVAKRISLYSAIKFNEQGIYNNSQDGSCYNIIFQLENGKREEFKVLGREYASMLVGDVGVLVIEGSRFIEFRKNK